MKTSRSCRRAGGLRAGSAARRAAALSLLFFALGMMPASEDVQAQNAREAETLQGYGGASPSLDPRDVSAQELFNQAATLTRQSPQRALDTYEQVVQRYAKGSPPFARLLAARALLNKGAILNDRGSTKDAIYTYDRIDRNFGSEKMPAIREVLASALVSKAEAFYKLGNLDKTLSTYAQFEKQFGKENNEFIKRLVDVTRWRVAEIRGGGDTALSSRP